MNSFAHEYLTKEAYSNDKQLLFGCVQPDIDEREDAYAHHFYNPVTLKDYCGSDDSAKNRCIYHFCEFLMTNELDELGRTLHFLEDICTPVHTQYEDKFDAVYRVGLHTRFEKEIDKFLKDGKFKSKNKKGNFSFIGLIDHCALVSSSIYSHLKESDKIGESLIDETLNLSFDAIKNINDIVMSKKIKAKKTDEINILIDGCAMYASTIEKNTIARIDAQNNLFIYKKKGTLLNFSIKSIKTLC